MKFWTSEDDFVELGNPLDFYRTIRPLCVDVPDDYNALYYLLFAGDNFLGEEYVSSVRDQARDAAKVHGERLGKGFVDLMKTISGGS